MMVVTAPVMRIKKTSRAMKDSLNSLRAVIQEILQGSIIGVIKGDVRSLDYSPYRILREEHR